MFFSEIKNITIFLNNSQKRIGEWQDFILEEKNLVIQRILLKEGKELDKEQISSWEREKIWVFENTFLEKNSERKTLTTKKMLGMSVETETGRKLGKIKDLQINEDFLCVRKILVKKEFFFWEIGKNKLIETSKILDVRENKIIVEEERLKKKQELLMGAGV